MKNKKNGFTLIELLAVIVILALIMGVAIFSVSTIMDDANKDTLVQQHAELKKAAEIYEMKYWTGDNITIAQLREKGLITKPVTYFELNDEEKVTNEVKIETDNESTYCFKYNSATKKFDYSTLNNSGCQ